jgi:aminoglycoside phosphotransferase (APT) family kinase protein
MSTIGHPLSDLVNLLHPYSLRDMTDRPELKKFRDGVTPGLPTREQILQWYGEVAGWDPKPDLNFGIAFGFFRASCIYQGIAARYAVRQASSAQAKLNGEQMHPQAQYTWEAIKKAKEQYHEGAKL